MDRNATLASRTPNARIARLLRLDLMLRDSRQPNSSHLCQELQISRRTLQRDIAVLRAAGDRIRYSKREDGYRAAESACILAELLTPKQMATVQALLDGLIPRPGSEFDEVRKIAAAKLRRFLADEFPTMTKDMESIIAELRRSQSR